MADFWKFGASELAEMIRSGRATSVEVVEAHLARIEAVNRSLNAMVKVLGEQALARASEIDATLAKGEKVGSLAGVPFTVKENIDFTVPFEPSDRGYGYLLLHGLSLFLRLIFYRAIHKTDG